MAIQQTQPSVAQLKRALEISEQIKTLQDELAEVLSGGSSGVKTSIKRRGRPVSVKVVAVSPKKEKVLPKAVKPAKQTRTMSPEAKQKIAEAQKRRWAKQKGE